jgi:nucleoid DNA-binding protein
MAGKADIVDNIAAQAGLSKKQAADAFDAAINSITSHLKKGDRVQVPGFGSFSISHRAARTGRNPATGDAIQIKASNNVRFKMGKDLKASVN